MWGNFVDQPVSLSSSFDLSVEKKRCDNEMKAEKNLSLECDTDFQSFLLPLEQDFTKSSKGYASLVVTRTPDVATPDKEIKSVDYENKLEKSEINMLHRENFSVNNYLKNSDNTVLNFSCTSDSDNLCYKKCTKITQLENVEDYQHSKTSFTKIILEDIKYDGDDSSESSDTDSSFNRFNNSINFDDYSDSDDSVIFSEDIVKFCQTMEIKKISLDSSGNSDPDDDFLKESKENTSVCLSKNFVLDFNLVTLEESSLTTFNSEGYVNASFEDDVFMFQETSSVLKSVNDSWNDSMKNISEEPHIAKKVSFLPLPDLVSIYSYEPEDDDYRYSLYVLDQLRFQGRIQDFESIISPYLTPEHRANIYQRNCQEEK